MRYRFFFFTLFHRPSYTANVSLRNKNLTYNYGGEVCSFSTIAVSPVTTPSVAFARNAVTTATVATHANASAVASAYATGANPNAANARVVAAVGKTAAAVATAAVTAARPAPASCRTTTATTEIAFATGTLRRCLSDRAERIFSARRGRFTLRFSKTRLTRSSGNQLTIAHDGDKI